MTFHHQHSLAPLAIDMEKELRNNILPFWLKQIDPGGGFIAQTDHRGVEEKNAPKGCLLNSRILWTFARAARQLDHEDCFLGAKHAYDYLIKAFEDVELGGLFWSVDGQGQPLDTSKHIYNQAFGVYALAEWYATCQEPEVLSKALELAQLIETYGADSRYGGYRESFNRCWQTLPNVLICDTEDVVSEKSMNTHLHILEAYSRLYQVHPEKWLGDRIRQLIRLLTETMQNPGASFFQFFSASWQVQSKNHSYGHDIEGSWLISAANQILQMDTEQSPTRQTVLAMAEQVLKYGRDSDGSVMNEWIEGRHINADKVWWVQAEAVVGFANAWQMSGDQRYLVAAYQAWGFTRKFLIDHDYGEWHWQTDRWGKPDENRSKLEFWKCPYHNGRACMEIMARSVSEASKFAPTVPTRAF